MSDNQQEQSPLAPSDTQCPLSSNSKKEKKKIECPVRTIDIFLDTENLTPEAQAWINFFETLFKDPRWISQTGYGPHSQLCSSLMCCDEEEAGEKNKAALNILTALGFKDTTAPGDINDSIVWDHPRLDQVKEILPGLYLDLEADDVKGQCKWVKFGQFLVPDVSWLEHVEWKKGAASVAEVETTLGGETMDGDEEETSGKVPLDG